MAEFNRLHGNDFKDWFDSNLCKKSSSELFNLKKESEETDKHDSCEEKKSKKIVNPSMVMNYLKPHQQMHCVTINESVFSQNRRLSKSPRPCEEGINQQS